MKPDRPPEGAGFIDQKFLNQVCLKHHISIGTVFGPLNRCILCGKKHINVVLDPDHHNNCIICSCAHFCGPQCA